jgi:hypothetical protein
MLASMIVQSGIRAGSDFTHHCETWHVYRTGSCVRIKRSV